MMVGRRRHCWSPRLVFASVAIILFSTETKAQSYTDSSNLQTALLSGYSKFIRPLTDQSQALSMTAKLKPVAILELDLATSTLSMTVAFEITWTDEKLTWTPSSYGNLNSLFLPRSEVWGPTMIIMNPTESVDRLGEDWVLVRYNSSGHATFELGMVVDAVCNVDVTYWPFDKQECQILLGHQGYFTSEVSVVSGGSGMEYYTVNGEWDITSISDQAYALTHIPAVTYTINLTRRPTFLFLNLLLPIICLMALDVCVFYLPSDSGERVGYSLTIILSITVFYEVISGFLPTVSQPMSHVTYYMMVNFIISIFICFGAMFSLRLYMKSDDAKPPPQWCKKGMKLLSSFKQRLKGNEVKSIRVATPEERVPEDVKCVDPEEELGHADQPSAEPELSWREVALMFDRIMFILFAILIFIFTLWFMADLATAEQRN